MEGLTIAGLAAAAGVNVETVRFYQRKGLLPEPTRPPGGIRRYGGAEVARIRFIKAAQRLGFALDEVAELLLLQDGMRCSEARTLAEEKLAVIRRRLEDLKMMEAALQQLVGRCHSRVGEVACPLIAALDGGGV